MIFTNTNSLRNSIKNKSRMSVNDEQTKTNSINNNSEDINKNSNDSDDEDDGDLEDEFQDELGLFTDDDDCSLNNDTDDDHDEQQNGEKKRKSFCFSKLSISTSSFENKSFKPKQPHIIYFNIDSSNREVCQCFFLNLVIIEIWIIITVL